MKYVAAVTMGFLASGVVYVALTPLPSARVFIALAFWAVSTYLLQLDAQTVAQVLIRGFLLGATEWISIIIAMIAVAIIVGSLNGLFKAALIGGVSLFMALLCLAGFAAVQAWQRAKSPSVPNSG